MRQRLIQLIRQNNLVSIDATLNQLAYLDVYRLQLLCLSLLTLGTFNAVYTTE